MVTFAFKNLLSFIKDNPGISLAGIMMAGWLVLYYPYARGRLRPMNIDNDSRYGMSVVFLCAAFALFLSNVWQVFIESQTKDRFFSQAERATIVINLTEGGWTILDVGDEADDPSASIEVLEGCVISFPLVRIDKTWTPVVYLPNGRDEITAVPLTPHLYQGVKDCDEALMVSP